MKDKHEFCKTCGQLNHPAVTEQLWDVYYRIPGGKQHIEPLVYTQDDLEYAGFYDDDESRESVMLSMENNMVERGLCPDCGRPDLRDVNPDDLMTPEEADDLADMYAEMAAERRAGC